MADGGQASRAQALVLAAALFLEQIGYMAGQKRPRKPSSKKHIKPLQTVEVHYSKYAFDVNAWMDNYAERAVEREVHVLADRAPQSEPSPQPASRKVSDQPVEAPDTGT